MAGIKQVHAGAMVYVKGHERVYVVWGTHDKHVTCVAPYALRDGPNHDDSDAVLDRVKYRDVLTQQKRSEDKGLYSNGRRSVVAVSEVWESPLGDCKLAFFPVLPVYNDDRKLVLDKDAFCTAYPLRVDDGVQHETE